jgi:hypothetical protein
MKYAVEMGSAAMIYTPSFIKTGSSIQKLKWGDPPAQKYQVDLISPIFVNNESRLKINIKFHRNN